MKASRSSWSKGLFQGWQASIVPKSVLPSRMTGLKQIMVARSGAIAMCLDAAENPMMGGVGLCMRTPGRAHQRISDDRGPAPGGAQSWLGPGHSSAESEAFPKERCVH